MDWDRYKLICDTPNVFSRWMLEQTRELAAPDLVARLERVLLEEPIEKPVGHRGGAFTDMFELDLSPAEVQAILAVITSAAVQGRTSSATRERGLGGFCAAWREYANYLDAQLT